MRAPASSLVSVALVSVPAVAVAVVAYMVEAAARVNVAIVAGHDAVCLILVLWPDWRKQHFAV